MTGIIDTLRHLLPRSEAFVLTPGKRITQLFQGFAEALDDARDFVDLVYLDQFPDTTRELAEFELQHGVWVSRVNTEAERRANVAAEMASSGGQSLESIQATLRAAGFDVYLHEWWYTATPYAARNPNAYLSEGTFGSSTCGNPAITCGSGATCNREQTSDPDYLVNVDLTNRSPPALPKLATKWPFFFYVGGQTFPSQAYVDENRRTEFEHMLLKLRPNHVWVGLLIEYVASGGSFLVTDGDGFLVSDGDDFAVAS